jgi:Protein of unknown function (DUF2865)
MANVHPSNCSKKHVAPFLGIAISLVIGLVAPPSMAQQDFSFFGNLFGFGAPQRSPQPAASAPWSTQAAARRQHDAEFRRRYVRVAPHAAGHVADAQDDDRPRKRSHSEHSHSSSSGLAVCVRLCDGRYFQLPSSSTEDEKSLCSAACPDATTAVFHTDGDLKDATDADGKSYSALPNAFAYRSRVVPQCACRNGKLGMASVAADQDPTLEHGDIVVTQHGPVVFHGKSDDDHHANFTPLKESRDLDSDLRHYVATLPVRANH